MRLRQKGEGIKQRKKDERIESILQQSEEIKSLDPHFTNTYKVIVIPAATPNQENSIKNN